MLKKDDDLYRTWKRLRYRGYPLIKRWNSFRRFANDMGPRPSANHKIRRLDKKKPHSPSNSYWEPPIVRWKLNYKVKQYGISLAEYDALVVCQNNQCAICGLNGVDNLDGRLYIDHDNETKKVRGLLCNFCNSGIGFLRHNTDLLAQAIKYLESSR